MKKEMKTAILLATIHLLLPVMDSSNILFLMGSGSKSHKHVFSPLAVALAQRGHNVTFISPFESSEKIPNLHERVPKNLQGKMDDIPISFNKGISILDINRLVRKHSEEMITGLLTDDLVQDIMESKKKYDLVVMSAYFNDYLAIIPYHLNVPFVMVCPAEPLPWSYLLLGMNPSYDQEPNNLLGFSNAMTFLERTINTLVGTSMTFLWRYMMLPFWDSHLAQFYPNLPSLADIQMNVSLVLTNTHHSMSYPHPTPLGLIEVGAMHCRPAKPLPTKLEEFVSGSGEDGVILLSFGSILRGSHLPEKARQIFVSVFSRIPQRVIWKWEDAQGIPNLSPNVLLYPWIPQQDLLGHPKVRLFISHGGLLSIQESIYHGCPLIGFPIFGNQPMNMQKAQRDGYAISHSLNDLTEDLLLQSIQQMLTNDSYRANIQRRSRLLRDQPETPLERAVYWTEYVARYGGAPHLRSSGRSLSFYQRSLYDVIFFLFVSLVSIFAIIATGCYFSCKYLRRRYHKKTEIKKKNN